MQKERLDRFLSNQSGIPRSAVRTGIKRGLAEVNGAVIKDGAFQVAPGNDSVIYGGAPVPYKRFVYIMLNKPAGVITASRDKSRSTVLDLVPQKLRRRNLAPVGRLDKDTTGLLILTDDGEFSHKCISPKSGIEKTYVAELDGDINEDIISNFEKGVTLADGYRCKPARLSRISQNLARVTVSEGKYHQIKRMFGTAGLGVKRLHRESVGGICLPESLKPGECVEIKPNEPDFVHILSLLDKTDMQIL